MPFNDFPNMHRCDKCRFRKPIPSKYVGDDLSHEAEILDGMLALQTDDYSSLTLCRSCRDLLLNAVQADEEDDESESNIKGNSNGSSGTNTVDIYRARYRHGYGDGSHR